MEKFHKGDYVLATKWSDGDPLDQWSVGFYDRTENGKHFIVDKDGKQMRMNGFRRIGNIRPEFGEWLIMAAQMLELAPSISLWDLVNENDEEE